MRGNPGFNFSNLKGNCEKVRATEAGLTPPGPFYKDAIQFTGKMEQVRLYDDKEVFLPDSQSIALKFASIDTGNEEAIIEFCSRYGPLYSVSTFANTYHYYYLYEGMTKEDMDKKLADFLEERSFKESQYLATTKKEIATMAWILDLDEALRNRSIIRIIQGILYICLDMTCLEFKTAVLRVTDSYQFRHALTIFAAETGYQQYEEVTEVDVTKYVKGFIDVIEEDKIIGSMGGRQSYPQSDCPTWIYLLALLNILVQKTKIIIEPFGAVRFGRELSDKEICQTINEVDIVKLGRAVFADVFKEHLHDAYPEIEFSDRGRSAGWHIPSFLSAMYLELFFRLSPEGKFRRCADPKCNSFFEWSPSHPGKKYCSIECAQRVAKRMERARKKAMKGDSTT